jgi:hypothetical protein
MGTRLYVPVSLDSPVTDILENEILSSVVIQLGI